MAKVKPIKPKPIKTYRLMSGSYEVRQGDRWTGRLIGWISRRRDDTQWRYTLARQQTISGYESSIASARVQLTAIDARESGGER